MLSLLSAGVYSVVSASHLVCTFYNVFYTGKNCVDEIGRHWMVYFFCLISSENEAECKSTSVMLRNFHGAFCT